MSSSSPGPRGGARTAALVTVGLAVAFGLGACSLTDDDEPAPSTSAVTTPGATPGATAQDTAPSGTRTGPTYARYVALGDSFAALGPTTAPTTGPPACHRSTRNYPALLAERADVGTLVDATCGGARTVDMTTPQIGQTPPQFEALSPDVDLVTLSIGGNDIGFGDIVSCIITAPRVATGAPCRDRLGDAVTRSLDGLGHRLDRVYSGIAQRSPDTRVITTAYLPLIPEDGGCGFVSRLSPGDVTWTRQVTERINEVVTDAAARAGAMAVLPGDAAEHHACTAPSERYTDFTGVETWSHPMHPTAAGHRAMADAVGAAL